MRDKHTEFVKKIRINISEALPRRQKEENAGLPDHYLQEETDLEKELEKIIESYFREDRYGEG